MYAFLNTCIFTYVYRYSSKTDYFPRHKEFLNTKDRRVERIILFSLKISLYLDILLPFNLWIITYCFTVFSLCSVSSCYAGNIMVGIGQKHSRLLSCFWTIISTQECARRYSILYEVALHAGANNYIAS